MSEIKIHKSLRHPNIVRFEHVFENETNVYMLMELCRNESKNELMKRRKRLTEFEARYYTFQLTKGLFYIHSQSIIHRDLKLGNLFFSDKMEIKIGDFGLAAKLLDNSERRHNVCGTPNYIAPETLTQTGHSFQVDLWSLGVVIFTLLVGKPPFETNEIKATYRLIKNGKFAFPADFEVSEQGKILVEQLVKVDPGKRIGLLDVLKHPFLERQGQLLEFLPLSTLACPLSSSYLRQFYSQNKESKTKKRFKEEKQNEEICENILAGKKMAKTTTKISDLGIKKEKKSFDIETNDPKLIKNNGEKENKGKTDQGLQFQTSGELNRRFMIDEDSQEKNWEKNQESRSKIGSMRGLEIIKAEEIISSKNLINAKENSLKNYFEEQICVVRYLECSLKYGFGYILSNGNIGVYFKDKSTLFLEKKPILFTLSKNYPPKKMSKNGRRLFSKAMNSLQI